MSAPEMRNLIHNTLFSAANPKEREILQGVHIIVKPDSIKAIGTDAHRLSWFEIQRNTGIKDKIETTLSVNTLKFIQSLLPYVKSKLNLSSNHDQFILKIGDDIKFVSSTLEGEYPKVENIIPQDETTQFSVDTESFMNFIDRVRLISHTGENNVVILNIDPDKKSVSLSSKAKMYGDCQQNVSSINIAGKKLKIAANPDFLYEILRVYKQDGIDEVALSFTKPLSPFLVNPLKDNQSNIINLVTPIKVY
ncbi:DNA polymerase III subunit beta [Lactobacillus crispatus]|nr:DNA polymerase III subunit beta [Lactobacillus crispatus]MDX5064323.1 DNA polymerase III subunit beta [Lactobacillus crispatus]MDX5106530.1 DNA polymerase III subunit beta [Lactobacillus crispatus]